MDHVLVIIVTYNGLKWMKKCLDSVRQSSIPLDTIIIDNGSTDGTQDFIKEEYPEMKFIQSDKNLGFGKANNIGMQYALDNDYDYIYLLNQDAWIFPDTIQILIDCHKRNPQYGILSPFQMEANLKHLDFNFNTHVCSHCKDFVDDAYLNRLQDIYSVPMVMAAHWLISKECLHKVGGFSPTFPHYGEDNNYADRAQYHNLLVGIVPKAKAVHDRENRKITNSQEIYRNYIGSLIIISNIYCIYPHILVRICHQFFKSFFTFHKISCVKYLINIFISYKKIQQNKMESKKVCAFLQQTNI